MCGLGIPLTAAFENIGKETQSGVWSEIFLECSRIMKEEHLSCGAAWRRVLSENNSLPLEDSDYMDLYDFGEMLGKSDRFNQEEVLELEKEKLSALESKARETLEVRGKLYRNLGALTGAAVVILLI